MKAGNRSAETGDTPLSNPESGWEATIVGHLIRHRRLLVALPLAAMCFGVLSSVLRTEEYVAQSLFLPHATQDQISGVAAQLGIELGGGQSGDPVALYAELLRSRELLEQAATTEYRVPTDDRSDSLTIRLISSSPDGGIDSRREAADVARSLFGKVSTNWDAASGLVRLRVVADNPYLAEQINRRLLQLLSEFNLERRQSQASAERQFVETRLLEAEQELEAAEEQLESFLLSNRRYEESPQLLFEYARLQRRVDLRQQVYSSLSQSFEQARIDEVRNTPVITVVDRPEGSAVPTGPGILLTAIFSLLVGLIGAVVVILLLEVIRRGRAEGSEDFLQLRAMKAQLLRERGPRAD